MARELGIPNAYTLEATFAGANFGPIKDYHMNGEHFQVSRAKINTEWNQTSVLKGQAPN